MFNLPEPEPEENDEHVLPHDPEEQNFLAELLGSADQTQVRQQADDRSHERRSWAEGLWEKYLHMNSDWPVESDNTLE